jgi:electron transfer flavoprotein beta subunit
MTIVVCIKQVPDTETEIKLNAQGHLDFGNVKWILNPYDESAIEEALQAKQKHYTDATIVAVCLGGPKASDILRVALAMGCDKAMHISIDTPTDWLSPLSVGTALANAINPLAPKLIICGKQGIDHDDLTVPYVLAENLKASCVNVVQKIDYSPDHVDVVCESDSATHLHYTCPLPVVLGVTKGINKPRYPSLPGIMKAKKQPIDTISLSEVLPAEQTTRMKPTSYTLPSERAECKMIEGDADQQSSEFVRIIREELKLL